MSMAAVATAYDPSRLPSAETQTVHEGGIKPYYVSKINQLKVRVPFHHNTHRHTHTRSRTDTHIHTHTLPLTFFVAFTSQSFPLHPHSPYQCAPLATTAAMPSDTSQHALRTVCGVRLAPPCVHF
jgi:hypothetical protein